MLVTDGFSRFYYIVTNIKILSKNVVEITVTFFGFENDFKLTIPEWIVHTFIAEHVYITPAM